MGDSGVGDKLSAGLFANPDSGAAPASTGMSLDEQLNKYLQYLPQISESQLRTNQALQPQYNALNLQQLQQFGLPTAQAQQGIANSNAMAGARNNANLLTGAGKDAAVNAQALQQLLNPNYYKTADNISRQTNNLLDSFNMKGLSGGEQSAVERSLNQSNYATGNLGLDNATNAVKNASTYGGAFNAKVGQLGNALGAANNSANTLAGNGGVNPVGIALGTSQMNQSNANPFNTQNYSPQGNDPTNSLLGAVNQTANAQMGLQSEYNKYSSDKDDLDSWTQGMGNVCCFIFLESYNGVLPPHVRQWRDYYYEKEPQVAIGYKRMAKWLVPLMKSNSWIKKAVNWLMVKPITIYGGYQITNKHGYLMKPFKAFWFNIWRIYGSR
jgi:hypothetical protein